MFWAGYCGLLLVVGEGLGESYHLLVPVPVASASIVLGYLLYVFGDWLDVE